jgi:outer membrane protein TolC
MAKEPFSRGWIGTILLVLCISTLAIAQSSSDSLQLSLRQAITLALEHHSDVRQAELALKIAKLELEAVSAAMTRPSIDLQVQPPDLTLQGFSGDFQGTLGADLTLPWGTRSQLQATIGIAWDSNMSAFDLSNWKILYSQDLGQPNSASEELKEKQEAVEDAKFAFEETRNDVTMETLETYSNLLQEKALLTQAKTDVQQAEANLEKVKQLIEEGLKGEQSLLEARLDALEAQIELEKNQSTYTTDKETFGRVLLGIDEDFELVQLQFPLQELKNEASELAAKESLISTAILESREVQEQESRVMDAEENLQSIRNQVLPDLGLEVSLHSEGLQVGLNIGLSIFSPTRSAEIEIAKTEVELAKEKLESTKEQARNKILSGQASLRETINQLNRLTLEEEKWTLEEKVKQAKFEAGLLSEEDWEEFLEEKRAFDLSKDQRSSSLLVAYLSYRDALGLELNWEEWLK